MANSGYKDYAKLEMYYVGDGASTGKTKNNVYGQPDYVSTVWDIEACPLPDTTPPTMPNSIWFVGSTLTSITVAWSGATDIVGVNHYHITLVGVGDFETSEEWIEITGLSAGTTYEIRVWSVDGAGNISSSYAGNYYGTTEDINSSISFQYYWLNISVGGGTQECGITSNYDELSFSGFDSWLYVTPSAYSGDLMLNIYAEYNFDNQTRYTSIYVYHGTTYVGSINIEQAGY